MAQVHTFPLSVHWTGSTLVDGEYSRDATAQSPGKPMIVTSAAPSYNGNGARWNPEDMFGAALATCHMLTFFALAKKAGVDVHAYDDSAEATLEMVDKAMRISKIKLAPTIAVAAGTDEAKVRELFEKAHKYCFVANSITTTVDMQPTVVVG
ncbi:MAG TPA: OsmC family protein [Kofleriaceae bacterium]|nr:OsmC family protein [Kofleriaceae bacterium]